MTLFRDRNERQTRSSRISRAYDRWHALFEYPHRSPRDVRRSDVGDDTRVNGTDRVNRKRGPVGSKDEHPVARIALAKPDFNQIGRGRDWRQSGSQVFAGPARAVCRKTHVNNSASEGRRETQMDDSPLELADTPLDTFEGTALHTRVMRRSRVLNTSQLFFRVAEKSPVTENATDIENVSFSLEHTVSTECVTVGRRRLNVTNIRPDGLLPEYSSGKSNEI